MKYVHLPLLQCHKLTALVKESNVSSVDNPSSMQVELTLRSDAKLVSDMPRPEVVTSTATSDDGAAVMPPAKSMHACSYHPGLASSAALDRLGFEPAQPPEACYSTY